MAGSPRGLLQVPGTPFCCGKRPVFVLYYCNFAFFFTAILFHNSYFGVLIDNIKNLFSFHFLLMAPSRHKWVQLRYWCSEKQLHGGGGSSVVLGELWFNMVSLLFPKDLFCLGMVKLEKGPFNPSPGWTPCQKTWRTLSPGARALMLLCVTSIPSTLHTSWPGLSPMKEGKRKAYLMSGGLSVCLSPLTSYL